MARPSYSTTLDSILATGQCEVAFRVLSVDLAWPDGEPPFPSGQAVSVPAVGATPPAYDVATFDATVWTDVTEMVEGYEWREDAALQCGELSLSVAAGWDATDRANVFREMRAILVQERYWGGASYDTGWVSVCWCLSDGFAEGWSDGHHLQVKARDALKLAGLEVLGAGDSTAVFQGDLVAVGSLGSHYDMPMVNSADDAWEFGVTVDGTDATGVHPDWADRPAPQFWCHNVPGASEPVPLAIAGNAVQAVFGEGLVRLGKSYALSSPGSPANYAVGLGFSGGTVPDVRCVLSRFAHPAGVEGVTFRTALSVPSDLADGLTVTASSAGSATVGADLTGKPAGLTLLARDGSGRRWDTTGFSVAGGATTFTVAGGATVPVGLSVQYADPNRLRDVLTEMALGAGYQTTDANGALYWDASVAPLVLGQSADLILPPMVFRREDGVTALGALAELRTQGYYPPQWMEQADANGRVAIRNRQQLADGSGDIIPIGALARANIDRSDRSVVTRVIARGLQRQVEELTRRADLTMADVSEANGGLPDTPAHTLYGEAVRSSPGSHDYVFALADLLVDRPGGATVVNVNRQQGAYRFNFSFTLPGNDLTESKLRPWAWGIHAASIGDVDDLVVQWEGKALCTLTWDDPVTIHALELHMPNSWYVALQSGNATVHAEVAGWSDSSRIRQGNGSDGLSAARPAAEPQALAVEYLSGGTWKRLASGIQAHAQHPEVVRLEAAEFDTRAEVTTTALRLVCLKPTRIEVSTYNESWHYGIVGVWLSRVKVFGSAEVIGTAAIGETSPFATSPWQAVRKRLRRRTYVLPQAVPWVDTTAKADEMALEWLKSFARDLAPRQVDAIRPDVRLWDTVSLTLPNGQTRNYLVTSVRKGPGVVSSLRCVDYVGAYYE